MTSGAPPNLRPALRLIVCDNDGCLLPEEPGAIELDVLAPIAEYNRAALEDPTSELPPLTIATGRPGPFVELLLRLVRCETIPAICEHGVLTYSLLENHARRDPAITDEHIEMIQGLRSHFRRSHPDWIMEVGKEGTFSVFVPEGGKVVDERFAEIQAIVEAQGLPLVVHQTVTYVNITLRHIDKATALTRVLKDLDIDPLQVLAIGDTAGDLAMADLCGHFACPANATEEVRNRSDYVSPFAITSGVVDILHHYTGFSCDTMMNKSSDESCSLCSDC